MILINNPEREKYDPFASLKNLRDNWSDEIPTEKLHGGQENGSPQFKVRKNWFQGVIGDLGNSAEDKIVSDELVEEINKFIEKFSGNTSDFHQRLTTVEDIAETNVLIDKILESQK